MKMALQLSNFLALNNSIIILSNSKNYSNYRSVHFFYLSFFSSHIQFMSKFNKMSIINFWELQSHLYNTDINNNLGNYF